MNVFLDMDNTIADSQKAFIDTHCELHGLVVDKSYTERWDFKDLFPNITKQEVMEIFTSDLYFERLFPLEGAEEKVKAMTYFGDTVYITTLCHPDILQKKQEWLSLYFPTANYIPIVSKAHDKSIINMKGGIFVDDRKDVLLGSNADTKILFKCKGNCDWQQGWSGLWFDNWKKTTIFD